MIEAKTFIGIGQTQDEALQNAMKDANAFIEKEGIEKQDILGCTIQTMRNDVYLEAVASLLYWK